MVIGIAFGAGMGVVLPAAASAQGWYAHGAVGQTSVDRLPADDAAGLRAGLAWSGVRSSWLSLNGGIPFDREGPQWGSLSAGTGLALGELGRASFSLNLAGSGYAYRVGEVDITGVGGTAEAFPTARIGLGPASITASTGPAAYVARDGDVGFDRIVLDSRLQSTFSPAAGLQIGGFLRHVLAEEGGYPMAGATASLTGGPVRGWVTAGRWLADDLDDAMLDAGVRIGLGDRIGLTGQYSVEASDPLFWNEARRGFSVGVDVRLGSAPNPYASPLAPARTNGEMLFRVPVGPDQTAVWVAGDFTGWERVPLQREGDHWVAALRIPPGVHHYAYVDDRGRWFLPPGVPRVDDGMGGESGVLIVD